MSMATYSIIGLVLWFIVQVDICINDGWEQYKADHTPGWIWIMDIIFITLAWPVLVCLLAIGEIFRVLLLLKKD